MTKNVICEDDIEDFWVSEKDLKAFPELKNALSNKTELLKVLCSIFNNSIFRDFDIVYTVGTANTNGVWEPIAKPKNRNFYIKPFRTTYFIEIPWLSTSHVSLTITVGGNLNVCFDKTLWGKKYYIGIQMSERCGTLALRYYNRFWKEAEEKWANSRS